MDSVKSPSTWNPDILATSSYHDYTAWHLKELVRLRFLKDDWPEDLREFFGNSTGKQMYDYVEAHSQNPESDSLLNIGDWTGMDLIYDFYRLRSADKLAIPDIGKERLAAYEDFFQEVKYVITSYSIHYTKLYEANVSL